MISEKISSQFLLDEKRLDGSYFLNEYAIHSRKIEKHRDKCVPLHEIASVFNPPIFKRQFCQKTERAVQYCQSSDVTNALEGSNVYINKKQAEKVGAIVKENQILVTGFGTIGNTRLVNSLSDGIAYANNVCRIETNPDKLHGFVYAFLSSKYGHAQLNKNASGSVVRYIEAPGIKKTLIPLFPEPKQQQIHNLIMEAIELRSESNQLLSSSINYFKKYTTDYIHGRFVSRKININQLQDSNKRLDANYAIANQSIYKSFIKSSNASISIDEIASGIFIGPRTKRNFIKKGIPFLSTSSMQKANPTKADKYLNKKLALSYMVESGWILTTRSGSLGDTILVPDCINEYAVSEDAIRIVVKENGSF